MKDQWDKDLALLITLAIIAWIGSAGITLLSVYITDNYGVGRGVSVYLTLHFLMASVAFLFPDKDKL